MLAMVSCTVYPYFTDLNARFLVPSISLAGISLSTSKIIRYTVEIKDLMNEM